ncbi:unnamed protein product, partial [Tenebrio molitor]
MVWCNPLVSCEEIRGAHDSGVCFYRCGNVYVGQTLGPCVLFTDII